MASVKVRLSSKHLTTLESSKAKKRSKSGKRGAAGSHYACLLESFGDFKGNDSKDVTSVYSQLQCLLWKPKVESSSLPTVKGLRDGAITTVPTATLGCEDWSNTQHSWGCTMRLYGQWVWLAQGYTHYFWDHRVEDKPSFTAVVLKHPNQRVIYSEHKISLDPTHTHNGMFQDWRSFGSQFT